MKKWRQTFLTNGIILVSGLVSGVIAARLLGAEDRGLLAAIIYWPHFLTGVAAMGLNEAIAIRIAKLGSTPTLRVTVVALSLTISLPLTVIGWLLLPQLLGDSRQAYYLFTQIYLTVLLPLSYLSMNLLAIDQGEFRFRQFNTQRIVQAVAYPMLLVAFWLIDYLTVKNAALAIVAGTGLVALTRLWQVRSSLKESPSIKEASELMVEGARLHATNLVMFLSMQVDKMALVLFSTDTQLGLYVVAVTAASAAQSLFVQTYINIMLPSAAKLGSGRDHIESLLIPLRRLFGVIIFLTVLMILIMPSILPLLFGKDFVAAVPYAQLLSVVFAFVGIKNAIIYLLRAWANNKPGVWAEGLAALILVAGAYPALQSGGVKGLVLLMLLAHAFGATLLLKSLAETTDLSVRRLLGFTRL